MTTTETILAAVASVSLLVNILQLIHTKRMLASLKHAYEVRLVNQRTQIAQWMAVCVDLARQLIKAKENT